MKHILITVMTVLFTFGLAAPAAAATDDAIDSEIIYSILVDRFNNGDQTQTKQVNVDDPLAYHGGDLQGITAKLDSLKELGYTTLVLSPIMENAPDGYHGYWIEDFFEVDDQFGTMEDLKSLVQEAHERDMKIVLEFVANYVSVTHSMTENQDKADWIKENNNVKSFQWLDKTAVLDQTNPEVKQFLTKAADYWVDEAAIDGYKFHAADQTNQDFLTELTAHMKEQNPNFYMLADILDSENYAGDLEENTSIQAVENNALYELMANVFAKPGEPVSAVHDAWMESEKADGLNYLDNEYTERFTQKFRKNGRSPLTVWKLALTYLYTVPGTPMIFQGSEIPMVGGPFPESQKLVRFNSADEDMEKFINRIASLRGEFPALQKGDYELLDSSGAMSLFKRSYEGESVYIAINNDIETQSVTIDGVESGKQLNGLLGDNLVRENDQGEFKIGLPRESADVYVVEEDTGLNWLFIGVIAGIFILFIAFIASLSIRQKKREADA